MFCPCFVTQYLVPLLVLQSSRWGRDVSVLCYFLVVPWLVYKFKRTVGKPFFSDQFKKIIKRYKNVDYSMDSMRQSACLVVNPSLFPL